MERSPPDPAEVPDLELVWPERLARVRRSQARTDVTGMTRPPRDPDERAFLAARGLLGPFAERPNAGPHTPRSAATTHHRDGRLADSLAQCAWPPLPARYATALRAAVAFVLGEVDAVGIVVAGTIVRGVPHASSDLDLYVIHEAPVRRRVQRYFGDPALGAPVPAEIFINPPAAVRTYFVEEHADGRPLTAHMLATGFVVLARGPILLTLGREAAAWLARPSDPGEAATVRERYDAATRYEDATDVADEDPAIAAMLLARAVTAMLELWCRTTTGTVPRGKDVLARVAALDPVLGALARRVFSDAPFSERRTAAAAVADRTTGVRGFFEWDSGFEPVPPG